MKTKSNNSSLFQFTKRLYVDLVLASFATFVILAMPGVLVSNRAQAQETKQEVKQEAKPEAVAQAQEPRLLAVEFYADWCVACKVLMPRIAEARADLNGKSVLFVRFDMTNDFTKEQATYMAGFAGLQDVYRKGGGKTGMVALVDAKTKNVLGVIGQKKSLEEIKGMFTDAISKTNGK